MEYPNGFVAGLPNCAIVSIAAITEQDYDTVWEWFRKRENRPAQWRGFTFFANYPDALKEHGKENSYLIFKSKEKEKGESYKAGEQRPIPLHYWVRIYSKKYPGKKFLVHSHNHTMAVDNGIVLDNRGIGPVEKHKSKGCRIVEAWIVE